MSGEATTGRKRTSPGDDILTSQIAIKAPRVSNCDRRCGDLAYLVSAEPIAVLASYELAKRRVHESKAAREEASLASEVAVYSQGMAKTTKEGVQKIMSSRGLTSMLDDTTDNDNDAAALPMTGSSDVPSIGTAARMSSKELTWLLRAVRTWHDGTVAVARAAEVMVQVKRAEYQVAQAESSGILRVLEARGIVKEDTEKQ